MTAATTIDEADLLLQRLAESEDEHARGAALYGSNGLFDHLRKAPLAVTKLRVRDTLGQRKIMGLADLIDDMARADGAYQQFLDLHLKRHAEWRALDAERQRYWMQLKIVQSRGYDAKRFGA